MPDFDLKYCRLIAPFSPERKAELLNFFNDQNELVQLEAFFLMQQNVKRLDAKHEKRKTTELHFACFLIALDAMKGLEEIKRRKGTMMDSRKAKQQYSLRVARVKGKKQKSAERKRLIEVRYYFEIKKLRDDGLSWRQVADYLNRYYDAEISFTYLREAFIKIQQVREQS